MNFVETRLRSEAFKKYHRSLSFYDFYAEYTISVLIFIHISIYIYIYIYNDKERESEIEIELGFSNHPMTSP